MRKDIPSLGVLQAFEASWYVRTELLGAVNNYYQVALRVV